MNKVWVPMCLPLSRLARQINLNSTRAKASYAIPKPAVNGWDHLWPGAVHNYISYARSVKSDKEPFGQELI